MTVEHIHSLVDPVQRQILGGRVTANGTYDPTDAHVSLLGWLQENDPAAAKASPQGRSQLRPPAIVRGKNLDRN